MKILGDSFVYEILLYSSSFMTSAAWLCYHLHFVQVSLIALYTFRENLSPSNIFDVVQNTAFFFSGAVEWEGRMTKREIVLVFNTCISNVDHFENCLRSSDMIWQVTDGNCFFVSGRVSFSTTFLPLYLPLMRSPVSSSELQREFW